MKYISGCRRQPDFFYHTMQHNIKAIFFDIDGTLVSFRTHTVPQSTIEALDRLRAAGIKLFIASGRHMSSINNLGSLRFDGYVTINGGISIVDGQIIHKRPLQRSEPQAMLEYMRSVRDFPNAFVLEDRLVMNFANDDAQKIFDMLNFPAPQVASLDEAAKEDVYQMISFFGADEEEQIMKHLPNCDTQRWNTLFTDVVPKGTSKVLGIAKVAEHFGFTAENIMAFGDGGNDIEMLRYASIGVAMGNAEQEVKDSADYVTDTVDDDGIAKAVKALLGI